MNLILVKTDAVTIKPMREIFLHEGKFQFIHNSYHPRNWADSYLFSADGNTIGYGSLCGLDDRNIRDTVFEFFILPPFRKLAPVIFEQLLHISQAGFVECQSNDVLLTQMLYAYTENINTGAILFEDNIATELTCAGVTFRLKTENDKIFAHKGEPEGEYVLDFNGEIVATGGFLLHYNHPYADLYMEVKEDYRRKGFGSFIIQELKKACYLAGRVPAARCGLTNIASKSTLIKAGFKICGYMLTGKVKSR
ncbi:MAG TPA: GNAT family N-acetyltransferase [Chitinophagaceae bacterium]|nr:GNAT family N-acetyltransferase [Chitinophagaceae bacterium]